MPLRPPLGSGTDFRALAGCICDKNLNFTSGLIFCLQLSDSDLSFSALHVRASSLSIYDNHMNYNNGEIN